jgi:hypothetical protein
MRNEKSNQGKAFTRVYYSQKIEVWAAPTIEAMVSAYERNFKIEKI